MEKKPGKLSHSYTVGACLQSPSPRTPPSPSRAGDWGGHPQEGVGGRETAPLHKAGALIPPSAPAGRLLCRPARLQPQTRQSNPQGGGGGADGQRGRQGACACKNGERKKKTAAQASCGGVYHPSACDGSGYKGSRMQKLPFPRKSNSLLNKPTLPWAQHVLHARQLRTIIALPPPSPASTASNHSWQANSSPPPPPPLSWRRQTRGTPAARRPWPPAVPAAAAGRSWRQCPAAGAPGRLQGASSSSMRGRVNGEVSYWEGSATQEERKAYQCRSVTSHL